MAYDYNIPGAFITAVALQFWMFIGGRTGHGHGTRNDRGRQDGHQGAVPQSGHLRDRGGARRLRQNRARASGVAGLQPRLCADLRRRHPRPQSQPAALALRVRPGEARATHHHRSAAPYRAAHAQARPRRADLHHLREQRQRRGDRSQDQQGGGRDRFRLDQRPSPDHRAGRPAALHRERGRRHRVGDRPAQAKAARQDQDAAAARRHRRSRPTAAPSSRSTTPSRCCS